MNKSTKNVHVNKYADKTLIQIKSQKDLLLILKQLGGSIEEKNDESKNSKED